MTIMSHLNCCTEKNKEKERKAAPKKQYGKWYKYGKADVEKRIQKSGYRKGDAQS